MKFDYYWNNVPGIGKCRNNLIYTSLISEDETTFCQWFYNDENYHDGQNEVIDPKLMQEKFDREIRYLQLMKNHYPHFIPEYEVDISGKKIYLKIQGRDFWNKAGCSVENYSLVVPNWEDQMLNILQAYKSLNLYKYSLHPSSYFVVDGNLKSINYFFAYHNSEGPITIADHASHIYSARQEIVREKIKSMNISWEDPEPLNTLQNLCFESFRSNYTDNFIEKAKEIYND
jgi:hypothetical protein